MIYVTGDTHALFDNRMIWLEQTCTAEDYIIVCGDFGFIWYTRGVEYVKAQAEETNMKRLMNMPCTILFIDGNHENFDRLNAYPEIDWNGGKVHQIAENIYHLERGYVYNIEGNTIFTMGGAVSIDKHLRMDRLTWWAEEELTDEEVERGLENLAEYDNKVDYVFTHAVPAEVLPYIDPTYTKDIVVKRLSRVYKKIKCKIWYAGHYHMNRDILAKNQVKKYPLRSDVPCVTVLYMDIADLGTTLSDPHL